MKTCIFCFLFLALCADSWAQLTCTNCAVISAQGTLLGTSAPGAPFTIPVQDKTFTGTIQLKGACEFKITGTGNYILSVGITGTGPLTYLAPDAGEEGNWAGVTLIGSTPNTYSGETIIKGGFLICNKPNATAIPGNLKFSAAAGNKPVHLWCRADNQVAASSVVDFSEAKEQSLFHLNGTTQTIAGLTADSSPGKGGVENHGNNFLPAGMIGSQFFSDNPAVLNIAAGSTPCVFGGGSTISKGIAASPAFTVNVISGTQIIQNPDANINNVTLTSAGEATLELACSSNTKLGEGVTFKGNGIIKKTGAASITTNSTAFLTTGGKIWLSEGSILHSGANNSYSAGTETNKAALQTEGPDNNPTILDLAGVDVVFERLTGNGRVYNSLGTAKEPASKSGYSYFTLNQNDTWISATFTGVIQDNPTNAAVAVGSGKGGIFLRKGGNGTQVLTGANRYTGSTTVSSGKLKLEGGALLGGGTYGGAIEIAHVSEAASQATFEHAGAQTQVFNGTITSTGQGSTKGIFLQSGSGKSIINGVNTFSGHVRVTSGFLGGSGSLKYAESVTVGANAAIGGGNGSTVGDTFTVSGLSMAASSKLIVTSSAANNNTCSLIEVKERGTDNSSTLTVGGVFTVDALGANLVSSRIIKCTNSAPADLPVPVLGLNNTGRRVSFRWESDGLYMDLTTVVTGLACNNCTFSTATGQTVTGTSASPALILIAQGETATDITLNGDCSFTAIGSGNYTLSGRITSAVGSNFSLTFNATAPGADGKAAGVTLSGNVANDYTGPTVINSGYVICNKENAAAIPHDLKLRSISQGTQIHLWCKADNQFGASSIIDFSDARYYSFLHLNGTTQTIAGIKSNNTFAVVENWENYYLPAALPTGQPDKEAILNITGSSTPCIYGGGSAIRKGTANRALTVNVTGGTQIIQNPGNIITNVILSSGGEGILEFNCSEGTYTMGTGNSFKGNGIIKKTGPGAILTNNSVYLKTGGKIWVSEGEWRNLNSGNSYATANDRNKAILQVDANATFDLMANNPFFSGLSGNGRLQNNWGDQQFSNYININRDNTETEAVFEGVIADNSTNALPAEGQGTGGIRLKKEGTGTQVLKGVNLYTGTTLVNGGTLKLQGGGQLGGGNYQGKLEIVNSLTAPPPTFEHNGDRTQVFNGPITNSGEGSVKGVFVQSGTGKSIINGVNDGAGEAFSGKVNITGGFLGGSGSLTKVTEVTVGANGSIGGGEPAVRGAELTVTNLTFAEASSKLVVTARPDTGMPSLVAVKEKGTNNPGDITAPHGFTVSLAGEALIASGYILKCKNGVTGNFPLPAVENSTGKTLTFRWDATGLYMNAGGLTCDNCSFTMPDGSTSTGTPTNLASIPGTIFSGNITLTGACKLTVTDIGNYTLSGAITGTGPLTFHASSAGSEGNAAGVTLSGNSANTYTGLTTVETGFIVCNKAKGVAAVPHDVKVADPTGVTKIWFLEDNQLGNGTTVVDFTDAGAAAWLHLNGSTQTVAGVKSNNNKVTLHSNKNNSYFPSGWSANMVKTKTLSQLNINAAGNRYILGGGAFIRRGYMGEVHKSPSFTLNVTGGTQVIEVRNPVHVKEVTLGSEGDGILELNTAEDILYQIGGGKVKNEFNVDVNEADTLSGNGHIKKTGPGTLALANTIFSKTGGKIQVSGGTLRNEGTTVYTTAKGSNKAVLEVDAANESNHNPTFDIWGNHSVFGGLTGGGRVQNNWSAASGASGGGFKNLILNQDQIDNSFIFNGIIRDNATNEPVSEGATGRGGISLKKEGWGTQVLTGANLYTGSTTVSAGTLKLQAGGRLGTMNEGTYTGIYAGALEISNVSAAASQAVFEYNGTHTQVFNGPITNTGEGAVKGVFFQSGTGKSIIHGVSDFSGHIRVTGGFLGGSADLRKAAGVTVGEQGSIGGGYDEAIKGNTLIVSNLTFTAATSKLIVSSKLDNNAGLVDVKTSTGAVGTVTATHGFTVKILGNNLVSGYVLKCRGGVGLPEPTLELPENSTLREKTRLIWDSNGLWMQVSEGAITLGVVSSVCPKSNSGNPSITVKVTYSDERLLPSSISQDDFFSLSDNNVKSGPIRVTRVGREIIAEFDGSNTTGANLMYRIIYDDRKNPVITSDPQRINRHPTLRVSAGGNPTCLGTPLVLQATGNGVVTISSHDTEKATVGSSTLIPATGASSATATTLKTGNIKFWASDINGCKSDYLEVVVNPLPVIRPENPSICIGTSLTLTANQDPAATSAWIMNPATSTAALIRDEVTSDKEATFMASASQATPTDIIVEYTGNLGCKGTTTVAIKTELTLEHTSTSPICSGTTTGITLKPSILNAAYTWTVSTNSVGAQSQSTAVSSPAISQVLTNNGTAPVSVTYSVKGVSGTCTGVSHNIIIEVSNLPMSEPQVAGGGHYCVDTEHSTYQTDITTAVKGGTANVEWVYTSFFPKNQAEGAISGNTQHPEKGTLSVLHDNLVLSGRESAAVYYVFRPYISCLGSIDTVKVHLYPAPVAVSEAATPFLCGSSTARIVMSSVNEGVSYTWTVDRTNAPDVSGYSEPSRDGASVSHHNPGAAKPSPLEEPLTLSSTALRVQTIKYSITPWRSGCPGKAVPAEVSVYPKPVLTVSSGESSVCHGKATTISLSNNFGEPEKNQVTYSWTATSNNTTGAQSSSNQPAFEQQILSLTGNATSGTVTYIFTPGYTPVAGAAFSCRGQSHNAAYTVFRAPVGGAIDTSPVEVCLDDPLSIQLKEAVAGVNVQWVKNNVVFRSGASLVVPTNEVSEAEYKVRVTNACGSIDSDSKKVKVTSDAYFTVGNAEAKADPAGGVANVPVNFTYTGPAAVFSWDFDDKTSSTDQNPSHSYGKAATYNPKLKVEKPGQAACNKTFTLSELKIKESPLTGDPGSSVTLRVFPIPAHDRLTVINDSDLQYVTISDVSGKTVMREAPGGRTAVLSVDHLADGIYILTVAGTKGVQRLKISKN